VGLGGIIGFAIDVIDATALGVPASLVVGIIRSLLHEGIYASGEPCDRIGQCLDFFVRVRFFCFPGHKFPVLLMQSPDARGNLATRRAGGRAAPWLHLTRASIDRSAGFAAAKAVMPSRND
jgi:hypothetical protein